VVCIFMSAEYLSCMRITKDINRFKLTWLIEAI